MISDSFNLASRMLFLNTLDRIKKKGIKETYLIHNNNGYVWAV